MRTIAICNLKGGVAKTVSAINIAHILAAQHGQRVLLIDNDKQGNTSKFFGLHDYDRPSIADVLVARDFAMSSAIRPTDFERLDLIPANMNLLNATQDILKDTVRPQISRLSNALESVAPNYDFAVIDNAPDLDMGVLNALCAADDVLVPVKIDRFAFDGLDLLCEQIESIRTFNARIRMAGCFVTMYQRSTVSKQGVAHLRQSAVPVFDTIIRKTVRVDEMTYTGKPLAVYAPHSTAAKDYAALVKEYLSGLKL